MKYKQVNRYSSCISKSLGSINMTNINGRMYDHLNYRLRNKLFRELMIKIDHVL